MSNALVPHFAFPFAFDQSGTAVVVEQDSLEEVVQCVQVLLGTTLEERLEQPDYGIPDQTFNTVIDKQAILSAIAEWEPRAAAQMQDNPDQLDALIRHVQTTISVRATP